MKGKIKSLFCGFLSIVMMAALFTFATPPAEVMAAVGSEPLPRPPSGTSRDNVLAYYSDGAFGDTRLTPEERAADIVSRMTRAEKIASLQASTGSTGAVPTLGIQAYRWWNEALHGIARDGLATSFPTPINMAATWDPDLMLKCATIMSDEGRIKSNPTTGRNGTALTYWSPTINLARDPRWGRNEESLGEDPYLTGVIASMFTRGLQGDPAYDPLYTDKYLKAVATMKHYAANNTEGVRRGGNSAMDDRALREYYAYNFQYIAENAKVEAVMSSYNKTNGVPGAAHTYLLDDLLRKTWGFDGHVVSDCGAISDVYGSGQGGAGYWASLPSNNRQRAGIGWSIRAGNDISCGSEYVNGTNGIAAAIADGFMTDDDLDLALMRMFVTRFRTGEFDPASSVPYRSLGNSALGTASSNDLALEAGTKSLVLLKNEAPAGSTKKLLPFDLDDIPNGGTVLLVGELANLLELGDYSADSTPYNTTIRQGLQNYINAYNTAHPGRNIQFQFRNGYYNSGSSYTAIATASDYSEALTIAATADLTVVYVGTGYQNSKYRQAWEGVDRPNLNLFTAEDTVAKGILAVAPKSLLVMAALGFYDVGPYIDSTDAFIWGSFNGQQQGAAMAKIIFGDANPSARLNFTWLKDINQYPAIQVYELTAESGRSGRTYQHFTGDITWPFGFGLSYTEYKIDNVQIDKTAAGVKDKVKVTFDVENIGDADGAQTVQIYVTSPKAYQADGVTRNLAYPIKQLKGFAHVNVPAGQKRPASVEIDVNDLFFFDSTALANQVDNRTGRPNNAEGTGKRVVYSGDYKIHVATSSADADTVSTKVLSVTGTDAPGAIPWLKTLTLRGEKVWAEPGAKIKSRLSVAMSDEMLYMQAEDATKTVAEELSALISRLSAAGIDCSVSFSSRNTAVAVVDQYGLVSAKTNGVTTITASVTFNGQTLSASYPFAVFGEPLQDTENAYITGILVNNQPLAGFDKDVTDYEMLLPFGSDVPTVGYVNGGNMYSVDVQVPPTIPGKATLTVANLENDQDPNFAETVYTLSIRTAPLDINILLDGAPLPGFDPAVYEHTVKLPKGVTDVPVVTVDEKSNTGLGIVITSRTVSGNTTVTIVITKGASSVTYTVLFKLYSGPKTDIFTTGSKRPFWYVVGGREDKSGYWINSSGLTARCLSGDIDSGAPNVFMQDAGDDDWTISTDFTMSPLPNGYSYPQAYLCVMQDEGNFLKVDMESNGSTSVKFQWGNYTNGSGSFGGTVSVTVGTGAANIAAGDPISLRIVRSGNTYTLWYKYKTRDWAAVGSAITKVMQNVKVGFGAVYSQTKPAANNFDVTFKNFIVNGDEYEYDSIQILEQPVAELTTTRGAITESLSVDAVLAPYGGDLAYQWYEVDTRGFEVPVEGATGATYALPRFLSIGEHTFFCTVSMGPDSVPDPANPIRSVRTDASVVTVLPGDGTYIMITEQPAAVTYLMPSAVTSTLSVEAEFDPPSTAQLKYQWYRSETGMASGGALLTGETGPAFTIPILSLPGGNTYYYYCVLSATDDEIESETTTVARVVVSPAGPARPRTDIFTTGRMRPFWFVDGGRENKDGYWINNTGLTIRALKGDIIREFVSGQNIFLQEAGSGDWTITTDFTMNQLPNGLSYPQAALIAMQDDNNYLKVDLETNNNTSIKFQFSREADGNFATVGTAQTFTVGTGANQVTANDVFSLRLIKAGNVYTAGFRINGGAWSNINTTYTVAWSSVKVGLASCWGADSVERDPTTNIDVTYRNFIVDGDDYVYDSIAILNQPASETTVTGGFITESISVDAIVSPYVRPLTYQWFRSDGALNTPVAGATSATFKLPVDLGVGDHFFYCVVTLGAGGAPNPAAPVSSVTTDTAKVTVIGGVPRFTDAATGKDLKALTTETLRVTMPYRIESSASLSMIVAIYNENGKLVHLGYEDLPFTAGKTEWFEVILALPENVGGIYASSGYAASVYLWNSATYVPLMQKVVFPE